MLMSMSSAPALRLEIIRRIAPGFRHKVLGKMQPIALIAQLLGKKIEANQHESEFLLQRLQELKTSLKAATNTADDLFTWLNPNEETMQPLGEIVAECLDLLKMEIYASNVVFQNHVNSKTLVKVSTVRNLFCACVLTYVDTVEKASEVVVSERLQAEGPVIEMTIMPSAGKQDKALSVHTTLIRWNDLHLLNESAQLVIENDQVLISGIA